MSIQHISTEQTRIKCLKKYYESRELLTSRERHKSAPYLSSKIANEHESVKNSKSQTYEKPKRRCPAKKEILLNFFTSIVSKHQKTER